MDIRRIGRKDDLAGFERVPSMLAVVGEAPFSDRPDLHLIGEDSGVVASCASVWWKDVPKMEGETLGCIGHFFASDTASGEMILSAALAELANHGVTRVVGPMNGNTWRKYRFVTGGSDEPSFALEPVNPDWWPRLWTRKGFEPLAGYHSSVITDLSRVDIRAERALKRLEQNGIEIREIEMAHFESELMKIYFVSERSFTRNFLYTPLPQDDFLQAYLPLAGFVDPRFALLAEVEGRPVGFVFGLPDVVQLKRENQCDTLIIKTLAVLPGREYAGLGTVLVERMREAALNAGYRRVIHALMYDSNESANIGKDAELLRRYTLYSYRLDS